MKVVQKQLKQLKMYENNPRNNDIAVQDVAKSISEFGFKVPMVIDKNDVIVCGHTRYKACLELGIEEVPCVVADDLTDDQIKAFRLVENKTNELATWDFDKLDQELSDIEIDMSEFDFDVPDIKDQTEIVEDFYDGEDNAENRVELGDLWQLGEHRLFCGDSTDKECIDALLDGQSVYLLYTDMPYGMNLDTDFSSMVNHLDFAKEKNIKNGRKYEQGIVDSFDKKMVDICMEIPTKETMLWGANYFREYIKGKNEGSWFVWDKRSNNTDDIEADYSSDKMYGSCFELLWSKKPHKQQIARIKWAGVFGTEQEFDHKRYHPTQKPIKLSSFFIEQYSRENDVVLDLFGGSGSTLIACEQLNRKCYMMELDPHYCDVIIDRWEKFTGKKAVKVN